MFPPFLDNVHPRLSSFIVYVHVDFVVYWVYWQLFINLTQSSMTSLTSKCNPAGLPGPEDSLAFSMAGKRKSGRWGSALRASVFAATGANHSGDYCTNHWAVTIFWCIEHPGCGIIMDNLILTHTEYSECILSWCWTCQKLWGHRPVCWGFCAWG